MQSKLKGLTIGMATAAFFALTPLCFAQEPEAVPNTNQGEAAGSTTGSTSDYGGAVTNSAKQAWHGTKRVVSDTRITTDIKSKLLTDATTQHSTIHVDTKHGVVTLVGDVPSDKVKDRALALAKGTSGVREIQDRIKVESPGESR